MRNNSFVKKILFVFLAICLCGSLFAAGRADADGAAGSNDKYPSRPITFYIVQAQGGATDQAAQTWRAFVEKELGVPIEFQYKPGANGEIGLTVLAGAEPDGYTFGISDSGTVTTSMIMQNPKGYNQDSFEYLVTYYQDPGIIMAHKDEPYNTLSELIAYMRTQPPETVSVGVAAMNDTNVVALRQIEAAAGVKFNIVNFNGGGKARTALAGHQIPLGSFMYYGSRTVAEETKILSRSIRETPVPALQNKEYHGDVVRKPVDDVYAYNQVMAPAGLKEKYPERYQYVIDAFKRALNSPEFHEHLVKLDQVEWLDQVYGDENDALNKDRIEFNTRIAPILLGN